MNTNQSDILGTIVIDGITLPALRRGIYTYRTDAHVCADINCVGRMVALDVDATFATS